MFSFSDWFFMSERAYKIAGLADTLLRHHARKGRLEQESACKPRGPGTTQKSTCAPSTRDSTHNIGDRRANKYECIEIEALIFYNAREMKMPEGKLRNIIHDSLDIQADRLLSYTNYIRIRDFLWSMAKSEGFAP